NELVVNNDTDNTVGPVYTKNGFQLAAVQTPPRFEEDLVFPGTKQAIYTGSPTLFIHFAAASVVLSRTDGAPFDLLGMDLIEVPDIAADGHTPINRGPFSILFSAVRLDGSTVTETVTGDPFPDVTHATFPGFSGVTSVTWSQGFNEHPAHQFDNIEL